MLTMTQRVYDLHADLGAAALFRQDREDGLKTDLYLNADAWRDMGSPERVTVTIEPGDLLNGEE